MREEIEVLEHHAHAAAVKVDIGARRGEIRALKHNGAAGRALQQIQAAQKGRLAGAGGADDDKHLALADVDGYAVESVHRTGVEMLFKILDRNDGFSAHCF